MSGCDRVKGRRDGRKVVDMRRREGWMMVQEGDGGKSEQDMNKTYRYRKGQEVVRCEYSTCNSAMWRYEGE